MTTDIRGLLTKEQYEQNSSVIYVPSILAIPDKKYFEPDAKKINTVEYTIEEDSILPSLITNEMTELNAAKASNRIRSFVPYGEMLTFRVNRGAQNFLGNNIQELHNQIIRKLSIRFDNSAMIGGGGNNGLITTSDPNVITATSAEIPVSSGDGFNQIQKAKEIANNLNILVNNTTNSRSLTVYFYGTALQLFLGKITAGQETDVRSHIQNSFANKTVNFVDISALALPDNIGNGIVVVSNEVAILEHAGLPKIDDQQYDREKLYYWTHYTLGSSQVRAKIKGAIIKQPITFAS